MCHLQYVHEQLGNPRTWNDFYDTYNPSIRPNAEKSGQRKMRTFRDLIHEKDVLNGKLALQSVEELIDDEVMAAHLCASGRVATCRACAASHLIPRPGVRVCLGHLQVHRSHVCALQQELA